MKPKQTNITTLHWMI